MWTIKRRDFYFYDNLRKCIHQLYRTNSFAMDCTRTVEGDEMELCAEGFVIIIIICKIYSADHGCIT